MTVLKKIFLILLFFFNQPTLAEKMDMQTINLLINKLESVVSKTSGQANVSYAEIQNRLGDLYAERARLVTVLKVENKCKKCPSIKSDRQKSINYYIQALPNTDPKHRGAALLQLTHLLSQVEDDKKAEKFYKILLKEGSKKHDARVLALANINYGDLLFFQGKYKQALPLFTEAARNTQNPKRGYAYFKKAWCQLNTNQTKSAIKTMEFLLANKDLVKDEKTKKIDKTFFSDIAHDYAGFLSRSKVSQSQISKVISLSPKKDVVENLIYMANEAERTGMSRSAALVWENVFKQKITHQQSLEGSIKLVDIYLNLNQTKNAANQVSYVSKVWKSKRCKDKAMCKVLQNNLKQSIVGWNKVEKKKLSAHLFSAYYDYSLLFKDDYDMSFWGAGVGRDIKAGVKAIELFHQTSLTVISKQKKQSKAKKSKNTSFTKILNGSLLGEIDVAETIGNNQVKLTAYNHYLKYAPKNAKYDDVLYQKAHTLYELKDYKTASNLFKSIVNSPGTVSDLKIKSADLALDSLVVLKDEAAIEAWSLSFAKLVPTRSMEYNKIARTSILNQSHQAIKKSDKRKYKISLEKLKKVPLSKVPLNEKIAVFKNRLVIAERLQNMDEAESAIRGLVSVKDLSESDKKWAYTKKLWIHEMKLDFYKAYLTLKSKPVNGFTESQKHMKLAVLAELSGKPTYTHYDNFIKSSRNIREANQVRIKLIKKAKSPWTQMVKYASDLKRTPDLLAELLFETYAKYRNITKARIVLEKSNISNLPQARLVFRDINFASFSIFSKKLIKHNLISRSDRLLQKSIERRVKLLDEADQWLVDSVQKSDWIFQIHALHLIAKQNARMHGDLLKLPTPKGLNPAQTAQYKSALNQKAQSFLKRAEVANQKYAQYFNNKAFIDDYAKAYKTPDANIRKILAKGLNSLKSVSNENFQKVIDRTLKIRAPKTPSHSQIVKARDNLKKSPFNIRQAQKLRSLEQKAGGIVMVAFLEARIKQLGGK